MTLSIPLSEAFDGQLKNPHKKHELLVLSNTELCVIPLLFKKTNEKLQLAGAIRFLSVVLISYYGI
jgi:hypothetical protein